MSDSEHGTWQLAYQKNIHSMLTVYFCIVITEKPQAIYREKAEYNIYKLFCTFKISILHAEKD